ncbi:MAG: hypothetical protein EA362_11855 [Saprospirales bacterium]|nr:MAG: hypothetical protein EA362_11855 [Saprospirales bacterium]
MLLVLTDFFGNSTDYIYALRFIKYTDFLFLNAVLCLLLIFLFVKRPISFQLRINNFRWIYLYPVLLLLMVLFAAFHQSKHGADWSFSGFLLNTIILHLKFFLVLIASFSSGAFLFSVIKQDVVKGFNFFISISLGFILLALILFILAAFGHYTLWPVVVVLILLSGVGWRETLEFFRKEVFKKQPEIVLHPAAIFLVFIAVLVTAVNFISITTAVPIGFDSLTLYLNTPMLMSQSGELIKGQMPYYWSIIMGIGYVVFDSNPIAQYIGIFGGVLSMLLVVQIGRLFISVNWAIFAAVIFYCMPLVLWQSSTEVKTDLGKLFFVLLAVALVVNYYFRKIISEDEKNIRTLAVKKEELILWGLVGLLCGFALGIKFTASMTIVALLGMLFFIRAGFYSAFGIVFLGLAFLFFIDAHQFSAIEIVSSDKWILVLVLTISSIVYFLLSFNKRENFLHLFKLILAFIVPIFVLLAPWAGKNIIEHGNFSLTNLMEGKDPAPVLLGSVNDLSNLDFNFSDYNLEKDFQVISMSNAEMEIIDFPENTGRVEELGRYLGSEKGFPRFFSLPYDLTMRKNVNLLSTDIGLMFLMFLPLLIFSGRKMDKKVWGLSLSILWVWMSLTLWSVYNPENTAGTNEIIDQISQKNYGSGSAFFSHLSGMHLLLIYPLLLTAGLLSPLYEILASLGDLGSVICILVSLPVLFFCFRGVRLNSQPIISALVFFSFVFFCCWVLFASGVPWYGFSGLAIASLLLVTLYFCDGGSVYKKYRGVSIFSMLILVLWLVMILTLRLSPYALGKPTQPEQTDFSTVVNPATIQYASGQLDYDEYFLSVFNPQTKLIIEELNRDTEKIVFNVGSMMRFFIHDNHKRVFDDNQLDFFTGIWGMSNKSMVASVNRFKSFGVDYFLLDLDVHTMDRTTDGTLTKKVEEFVEFLHNNQYIELIGTDRLVEHPLGDRQIEHMGRMILVRNDIFGTQIIERGKLALFRLK